MNINDVFEPLELVKFYNRFLCVINDWYGATNMGMRERAIRPNSYIGLKTYFPPFLDAEEYAADKISFDLEYEFGVIIPPESIKCMKSIQHLFYNLLNRVIRRGLK